MSGGLMLRRSEFIGRNTGLHQYLERAFPQTHAALTKEAVEEHSLIWACHLA